MRRLAVVAALLAVALVAVPAPAWAHAALLGTSPASDTTVTTTTTEVTLTFNEVVRGAFSTVTVSGPGDRSYSEGAAHVIDNVLHQAVYPLASGSYSVGWRTVSADGHPIEGSFAFTVDLPPELEPTAPPPDPVAEPEPGPAGPLWWIAAVVVAAGVGVVIWRVRRRA